MTKELGRREVFTAGGIAAMGALLGCKRVPEIKSTQLTDDGGNKVLSINHDGIGLIPRNAKIEMFGGGQHLVFGFSTEKSPAIRANQGLNGIYYKGGVDEILGITTGGNKAMEFSAFAVDKISVYENVDHQGNDVKNVGNLDVEVGSFKGLVELPRLNTKQRDSLRRPKPGSVVFNLDSKAINVYDGRAWKVLPFA